MRLVDGFIQKIVQKPIFHKEFFAKLKSFKDMEDIDVEEIENLRLLGLPITKYNNYAFTLETLSTSISEQKFCIVDIETNGSKPNTDQIIEIGSVMIQGGKEIGRFSSLVKADILPDSIAQLTGISLKELEDAPSLKSVLESFRLFLKDAVFVAHNVNFDYYFISTSMEKAGFGPLLNRRLCTIDLARKTLEAPKYGLGSLMAHLGFSFEHHHRALCDAQATVLILLKCLEHLPEEIISVEELIFFAKPNQKRKKEKKVNKSATDTTS